MSIKLSDADIDDLILKYKAGTSLLQLSKELNCDRSVILRRLTKRGVNVRGRSEAEKLKWSFIKRDRSLVARQCGGAWNACRGREIPMEERERKALGRFKGFNPLQNGGFVSPLEKAVSELIPESMNALRQFPIGPYNVDFAFEESRISVELQANESINSTTLRKDRLEYILDHGWTLLIIYTFTSRGLVSAGAIADHIIRFIETFGPDPSSRGKYRVIWGNGELVSAKRFNIEDRSRI